MMSELDQVQQQITALQQEAQRLRQLTPHTSFQLSVPVSPCHPGEGHDAIRGVRAAVRSRSVFLAELC